MIKLTDLNPKFGSSNGVRDHIIFDCPKCRDHRLSVPIPPNEKAWEFSGDSFENYSLHPSVAVTGYHENDKFCDPHFFLKNGEIQMV